MRTLLFFFLSICQFLVFPQTEGMSFELFDPQPVGSRDFPTFKFVSLSLSSRAGRDLYFAYDRDNSDGVCKSLGYEKSQEGSARWGFTREFRLTVSSEGKPLKIKRMGKYFRRLTCLDRVTHNLTKTFLFHPAKLPGDPTLCIKRTDKDYSKFVADIACEKLGYDYSIYHYDGDIGAETCWELDRNGQKTRRRKLNFLLAVACVGEASL